MLHGRDRRGLVSKQTRALNHPLRLRILEIAARGRGQLLSVEALTEALVATPGYEHTKRSEVNYHRACLQDARLLPTE